MRSTRFGILKITDVGNGKDVVTETVPSSSRTRRAYDHLHRLKRSAKQGERYRMLDYKLSTALHPFTAYSTPSGK